jgi:hypothetical protein
MRVKIKLLRDLITVVITMVLITQDFGRHLVNIYFVPGELSASVTKSYLVQ